VRPRIAITIGDPAGIGPEIAAKAAADDRVRAVCEPVLYGPSADQRFEPGVLSAEAGRAAYDAVCAAVKDALAGVVGGMATAPINKLAFARAGLPWKGHTDLIGHLTGSPRVAMMFWSDPIKVVLATVHVPLASVPSMLTRALVDDIIDLTARELPSFGVARVRLAVAGLNPHAGEEGLFGDEEQKEITPAVEAARRAGLDVYGPLPADTLFSRARGGEFDIVVAMYHDQGHVPVKTLGFVFDKAAGTWTGLSGVNVTVGLPFLRVSVDHGTAFDRAWKGIANPESMVEAIDVAVRMLAAR